MFTGDFAAAFVAFMNSGLTKEQLEEIAKLHQNQQSHWDTQFTQKESHDNQGNKIEGKYFLSSDTRMVYKNPKNPILLRVKGETKATTQIEIPTVICRNIQSPEAALAKAESAQAGRVLTQLEKQLQNPEKLTDEQKQRAKDLLARLG